MSHLRFKMLTHDRRDFPKDSLEYYKLRVLGSLKKIIWESETMEMNSSSTFLPSVWGFTDYCLSWQLIDRRSSSMIILAYFIRTPIASTSIKWHKWPAWWWIWSKRHFDINLDTIDIGCNNDWLHGFSLEIWTTRRQPNMASGLGNFFSMLYFIYCFTYPFLRLGKYCYDEHANFADMCYRWIYNSGHRGTVSILWMAGYQIDDRKMALSTDRILVFVFKVDEQ